MPELVEHVLRRRPGRTGPAGRRRRPAPRPARRRCRPSPSARTAGPGGCPAISSRLAFRNGATSTVTVAVLGAGGGEQLLGRRRDGVGVGQVQADQAPLGLVGDALAVELGHDRVADLVGRRPRRRRRRWRRPLARRGCRTRRAARLDSSSGRVRESGTGSDLRGGLNSSAAHGDGTCGSAGQGSSAERKKPAHVLQADGQGLVAQRVPAEHARPGPGRRRSS